MEVTAVIPENVADVTLPELQMYTLQLAQLFGEYSREVFSVRKRKTELNLQRQSIGYVITGEVQAEQKAVARMADRLSPRERNAAVQSRINSRFPRQEEYEQLCIQEAGLQEVKVYLDFIADRLKQAVLTAATRKKYGGTIT